jgi:ferredoxin
MNCIETSKPGLSILLGLGGPSIKGLRSRWETNVSDADPVHPKNAAGPFYVLNGCCTACGVPTAIAPELFEFDSTDHCYVRRQPNSNAEMEKALHVLRAQELDCIRYRGTDEAILRRLAEAGEAHHCDHPPAGVGVVLRNVVTFALSDSSHVPCDASRLLEEFCAYVKGRYPHLEVRTKPIELQERQASFALAWFEDHFHPIAIRPVDDSDRWLILHRGNLGLSEFLDDWLRSRGHFKDLRWYTEDGWQRSEGWQSLPW